VRLLISLLLVSTGCLVTRAPKLEERPRWRAVGTQTIDTPCASGRAFVRKSGKQGVGLTLMWKSRTSCTIAVESVHVALDSGGRIAAPLAMQPIELPGRSLRYTWLPVAFDNNRVWNDGSNTGVIEVALAATSSQTGETPSVQRTTWRISMEQK
jgi:hypothetical protein